MSAADDASPRPSRILLSVGPAGCGLGELPGRLGLSPTLAPAGVTRQVDAATPSSARRVVTWARAAGVQAHFSSVRTRRPRRTSVSAAYATCGRTRSGSSFPAVRRRAN